MDWSALSATEILAQSSNIGTYEIGERVGESGLLAQVQRLGFGQTTAINFPDETPGLLINAADWYASDQVALPIGQVDAVPAIQVLDAYNTIANGGVFVEPKLVRAYVTPGGAMTATPKSATRRGPVAERGRHDGQDARAGRARRYGHRGHYSRATRSPARRDGDHSLSRARTN